MTKEEVGFCFPEVIAENEALLGCLLELLIVTLMAPYMSIQGAKKWGILNQSTSNCYKRIEEIGKMLIIRKGT
jgi:hypothetical protein